jgi:glycosyltransferase involved in cell wall biosynthesis
VIQPGPARWTLVLPGRLDSRTGGTIYDRRLVEQARARGEHVRVVELVEGRYPTPSPAAVQEAEREFAGLPDGEVVVVDGLALGALPGLAAEHAGRLRLVALVHHPLCDEGMELRHDLLDSERQALACVQRIVVTSEFTRSRLEALGMIPSQITPYVVEPGVDPAPLSASWQPGTELRLLSVGSLTPRKAHVDAIRALADVLVQSEQPWRWTLVGRMDLDGEESSRILRTIEEAGLGPRVDALGEVSDVDLTRHYHESHVLLHPARYEGFGMVITEALARGLPVLCSSGGALGQTLAGHGSRAAANGGVELAGAVHRPGDTAALSSILVDLLETRERWSEWRATAVDARSRLDDWRAASQSFSVALHF